MLLRVTVSYSEDLSITERALWNLYLLPGPGSGLADRFFFPQGNVSSGNIDDVGSCQPYNNEVTASVIDMGEIFRGGRKEKDPTLALTTVQSVKSDYQVLRTRQTRNSPEGNDQPLGKESAVN